MNRKITKSLSALLLLTAIVVTQIPAADAQALVTSEFQMDGTKLVRYAGTAEVVSVPDEVRSIGEEAFAGNDSIVKVSVGERCEKICYRAFAECDNLRTIDIKDSVTEIEAAAFCNNKELINVNIGAGLKTLGSGPFAGCSQLAKVTLSEDNKDLIYSDGVLYDADMKQIFALMPAYEKTAYTAPSTVSQISGYAFWGNPYLERVVLDSKLYEVPAYAFSNCANLKEVDIPLPVRGIGAKAFEDCVNLQSVKVPESVSKIHDTAFDGCPVVKIDAKAGSYGAEFADKLKKTEAEEVEYEDIQNAQVINGEDISNRNTSSIPNTEAGNAEKNAGVNTEGTSPQPTTVAVQESYFPPNLLGESSIVGGRAVIFINNKNLTVLTGNEVGENTINSSRIDLSQLMTEAENPSADGTPTLSEQSVENLLADNAQKGKDFPKYTIVGDSRIASQAFYQQEQLNEYEIPAGITHIGDFAFSRSGITTAIIPEGVKRIGYGAFYHCDKLEEVQIPSSVTEIDPYAFGQTPWLSNLESANAFIIAGDGILISYTGSDSVVNIPSTVKQIGPGVFKDHSGITAVNIPASVQTIGEEAFMGCQNLKTVNGGSGLIKIDDRAFMNCPLSKVVIPASVTEIGLGAYALSGGTDTVVFEGESLPTLTTNQGASRLANEKYRTYAFKNIKTAIIGDDISDLDRTILETGTYGFAGVITDNAGNVIADNSAGAANISESGIVLQIDSKVIASDKQGSMAAIPGEEGAYVLSIKDSESAFDLIKEAYGELYGGKEPIGLSAYDISLYDASGSIPITKLGKQNIVIQIPMPSGISTEGLHIVTLDNDGQMEAVEHRVITLEDGDYLQFNTNHFSPFGIYQYLGINGQASVQDGNAVITNLYGNKDNTPDTGDGLSPKWFLAIGLTALAVALFFYKGKAWKEKAN